MLRGANSARARPDSSSIEGPEPPQLFLRHFLAHDRCGELQVLVLQLGIGQRGVRVADARRLKVLFTPAMRLDGNAGRALRRESGIELGGERKLDALHEG